MTKTAVIIGGGIAGSLAAIALHEVGISASVYESHGASSDGIGAFLTLAVNGLAALEPLGLTPLISSLGMETPHMRLISGRTGSELGSSPMKARTVSRSDLYTALRVEAERRGITIHYDKTLVDGESEPSAVRAQFDDGSSVTADLLVGADGLRSRTRTLLDPAAPTARDLGLLNTGGYARGLSLPVSAEPGAANFVFGKRCFFGWFLHPNGEVWWFANPPGRSAVPAAPAAPVSLDDWRAHLNDLFADDHGPMLDIIAATDEIFPPWSTYDFPRVPVWHDGRMVIIGDAAHATSPSAGQGASMAMEDAVTLARCVRDLPVAGALATYEGLRRARVEKVVAQGRRNGSGKAAGPIGARLRDAMMPMVLRRYATPEAQAWLLDHRIDFGAPVRA